MSWSRLGWLVLLSGCSLSQGANGVAPHELDARVPTPREEEPAVAEPRDDEPPAEHDQVPSDEDEDEADDVLRPNPPLVPLDAGHIEVLDAALAQPDADAGGCEGSEALGLCWHLAARGVDCSAHCATHGGFDARSLAVVGTPGQGGSLEQCARVLQALDVTTPVYAVPRYDLVGIGCHRWASSVAYWVDGPVLARFAPDNAASLAEIACACSR